jgi:hypothetical protein
MGFLGFSPDAPPRAPSPPKSLLIAADRSLAPCEI